MRFDHIEKALSQVENHFDDVSIALVSGEPLALFSASEALRQAALGLSDLLQNLSPSELGSTKLKSRLRALSDGMLVRRESLIRRTVMVERALHSIVPSAQGTDYVGSSRLYASVGKQTGAFKVLAA